ncbi:polysaccharide biosynthesis tyrosine autokinase [Sphingobium sp. DC-2]|uniref:GumC family protein n=1 Tax=Sphingobium sp. DC-2 TaxID=1303256 RepID=UPI0004C3D3CA|nr:polysaccharide biosynthesis tyrosine autokinase [Sphingobium sp. DC-2]
MATIAPNQITQRPRRDDDGGSEGIDIDFPAIWNLLRRNVHLIGGVVAIALLIGVVIVMRAERLYRATATVQIEEQSAKVLNSEDGRQASGSQEAERFLQTQLSLLNSRAMAQLVVKKLNLASRIPPGPDGRILSPQEREEAAIAKLQSSMSLTLPRDSRVAQITITDRDPRFVADAANAYAEEFIQYNLGRRFGETSYARTFLENELGKAKKRLEASEVAVVDYARRTRLIDATGGKGTEDGVRMLTSSNLMDINSALGRAKVERIEAERRWRQAQATPALNMPEVMTNPAVQQLVEKRALSTADYSRDREKFREDYPGMRDRATELTALNNEVQKIAQTIRGGLRNNYEIAVNQERALASQLESLKTRTVEEQNKSIGYNILRREVDTNRLMYDGLLQRFKEVSAAAGVTANNISIVDRAEVPNRPFTPRTTMTLLSSLASGFALALVLVGVRSRLDDIIRSPEDVASALDLPVLATIPSHPSRLSMTEVIEGSSLSEAFWSLRLAVERTSSGGVPRSLLFTSSRSSEGKSTCAYAVALNFARSGRRVLFIDADLRRPTLHRAIGLPNDKGLASVLAGETTLNDAIRYSVADRLDVLTGGQPTRNPAELLAQPVLASIIAAAEQSYDLVVIDSAPVLLLADAIALASAAGATVFVVEANGARAREARAAVQRLDENGARLCGAVLTKYDRELMQYRY